MCVLLQSARLWFEVLRFEEFMYYGLCTIKQWYNKTINTRFEKQWTQGFTAVSGVSRSSYGRSALIHSVYRHAARLPTAQLSAVVRLSIRERIMHRPKWKQTRPMVASINASPTATISMLDEDFIRPTQ